MWCGAVWCGAVEDAPLDASVAEPTFRASDEYTQLLETWGIVDVGSTRRVHMFLIFKILYWVRKM